MPWIWPSIRRSRPSALPRVSSSIMGTPLYPTGVLYHRGQAPGGLGSGGEVGEQRPLLGGGRTAPPVGRRLGPLALGLVRGGALAARLHPTLLTGDLVALLDQEEVDQAGERIPQQLQVLFPIARRVGEGLHLVGGESQRGAIALTGGEPKLVEDLGAADARGSRHLGLTGRSHHTLPGDRWAPPAARSSGR